MKEMAHTVGSYSLQAVFDLPKVEELLVHVDQYGSLPDDERGISRQMVTNIILAALWGYAARAGSTASGYANLALWEALGVDFFKSTIARLPTALPTQETKTKEDGE